MSSGAMVKTRRFNKQTYLGDPVNIISLFNNFEVDEIVLLDIAISREEKEPNFDLIAQIAEECWVPVSYGGGVRTIGHIEKIIRAGCEKVIIGTAAEDLSFISKAAAEFGTQAIVGSVDVKCKLLTGYDARILNGRRSVGVTPPIWAKRLADAGAGELLLQSVDRDGEMCGYDLPMIRSVVNAVNIPVVTCGGAADRNDLARPVLEAGASASAAGSIFVFSGPERGVLVNYPERPFLEQLFQNGAQ
jgi:cyclase